MQNVIKTSHNVDMLSVLNICVIIKYRLVDTVQVLLAVLLGYDRHVGKLVLQYFDCHTLK